MDILEKENMLRLIAFFISISLLMQGLTFADDSENFVKAASLSVLVAFFV